MDTDPMEAESLPAPPATTPPARDLNAHIAEDEEEMPLLFMDELPSNFQQNAQLAAIATFMADSDDDAAAEDDEEDASRAGTAANSAVRGSRSPHVRDGDKSPMPSLWPRVKNPKARKIGTLRKLPTPRSCSSFCLCFMSAKRAKASL